MFQNEKSKKIKIKKQKYRQVIQSYGGKYQKISKNAENGGLQGKVNGAETRQAIAIFSNKFCRTI